ncbi:MAG: M20/M25/M40 family metallo-hydrolase [Acidaminococcaceae bacterium]
MRGLGHGCGHHMQGPGCIGAAIALKNICIDAPYKIIVYGTPAEETFGAKCVMLQKGCFKELDVAFMMNVVPKKAVGEVALRSFSKETLNTVVLRFRDIIKGTALIAGVDYELTQKSDLYNKIPVFSLNELLMNNAKIVGAPQLAPPREKTGSTDFGNVMYEVPGSCIRVAFVPEGTSSHTQEFVDAGKSEAAHKCVIYGAKAIAGAALDLIENPEKMEAVKKEFAFNKAKYK